MLTKKPWRLGTRAKLLMRGLRYSRILPYASIDGWLTVDEAIALYELAKQVPEQSPRAVEIGCWQGKSTVCIAQGLRDKAGAQLMCIDPFDASGDDESRDTYGDRQSDLDHGEDEPCGPLRRAFEANLTHAAVRDLVDVRAGFSHEHTDAVAQGIDLLFLDGDHSYEAIRRDFEDWSPKIRPGGLLAMHDVVHPVHQGPRRVVEECIANNPQWVEQRYVDSMFVARKQRS